MCPEHGIHTKCLNQVAYDTWHVGRCCWLAVSLARSRAEPAVGPFDSPTEGIPQPRPSHGLALCFFEVLPGSFDFGYTGFVVTFLSTRDELHGQGLSAGPSAAPAGENIFTPLMVTAPARLADEVE